MDNDTQAQDTSTHGTPTPSTPLTPAPSAPATVTPAAAGRIVHYGLRTERGEVVTRPAIVAQNLGTTGPDGTVSPGQGINVQVITDGANDFADGRGLAWRTSVLPGSPGTEGAWWWPAKQ